jgi:PII-like signaling protein
VNESISSAGGTGLRVRVYIGEGNRYRGQPLYTAIVEAARHAKLGGATVFKGVEGYGAHSVVHAARVFELSADLPVLVELIDEPERIQAFLPTLRAMLDDGMMTVDNVTIAYRSAGQPR